MNLAFSSQQVRRLCENEAHADRVLGVRIARTLRRRLADLAAIGYVIEMVPGRPTEIAGTHHVRIDLGAGAFLVFCSNHNNIPLLKTDAVAWASVSRIKILNIEVNND